MAEPTVRGVFVIGCPRSGTTVVGRYIGSAVGVCDLGEYGGFHIALYHAPRELRRMPGQHKPAYLRSLAEHAADFARSRAHSQGYVWFLDDTPWNLLSVGRLCRLLPDAVFVLCLRHYRGAIQSLQRSYAQGYTFAGRTPAQSAELWRRFYRHAAEIPAERSLVVSYDQLCANPDRALAALDEGLSGLGIETDRDSRRELAKSHAVPAAEPRPTLARVSHRDGTTQLTSRASFDPSAWSSEIEADVLPVVAEVDATLAQAFPDVYVQPHEGVQA